MARHFRTPPNARVFRKRRKGREPKFAGYIDPSQPDKVFIRNDHDGDFDEIDLTEVLVGDLSTDAQLVRQLARANHWSLDETRNWLRLMGATANDAERMVARAQRVAASRAQSGPTHGPNQTETPHGDRGSGSPAR